MGAGPVEGRAAAEGWGGGGRGDAIVGLNLSILDGWWPEGFNGENGWSIGDERSYGSADEQDMADLESLYLRLAQDVIPNFFDRNDSGVPLGWTRMMKSAIASCTPAFHSDRQVIDYVRHIYTNA